MPSWQKSVLFVLGIFVVFKVVKNIGKLGAGAKNAMSIFSLGASGIVPSYSDSQYDTFAEQLNLADGDIDWMPGIGNDDEETINNIFSQMMNDADLSKLDSALIRSSYGANIVTYLEDVYNRQEINELNAILLANGCTKQY